MLTPLFTAVPQVVYLTKLDKVCPLVDKDVSNMFKSMAVKKAVDKTAEIFGLPRSHVLPAKKLWEGERAERERQYPHTHGVTADARLCWWFLRGTTRSSADRKLARDEYQRIEQEQGLNFDKTIRCVLSHWITWSQLQVTHVCRLC